MNNNNNAKTEETNTTAKPTINSAVGCTSPPASSHSTMITGINTYHPVTTVTPSPKAAVIQMNMAETNPEPAKKDQLGLTTSAQDVVTSSTFMTAVEEIVKKYLKKTFH